MDPPLRTSSGVDQFAGRRLDAAGSGCRSSGAAARFQHGQRVRRRRVQTGSVGGQVGEQTGVVGVGQTLVEKTVTRTRTA